MKKEKRLSVALIFIIGIIMTVPTVAQTVYITKTGSKYHTESCRYIYDSKIAISLSDAKAKSYTPCSVCKPSSSITSSSTEKKDTTAVKVTPKAPQQIQTTKPATSTTTSKQCSAITQAGTRCKRTTKSPNGKCWQHGGN